MAPLGNNNNNKKRNPNKKNKKKKKTVNKLIECERFIAIYLTLNK